MHAFYVDALPILNESGKVVTHVAAKPAHHHLIETLLQTEEKTTLLFTGPLTDLARALYEAPIIENKIKRLVWMGGTFRTAGNVHEPEHDGTAEWNSFWDPEAVARVWEANIEIDLITLESTNQVPLTIDRVNNGQKRESISVLISLVNVMQLFPLLFTLQRTLPTICGMY